MNYLNDLALLHLKNVAFCSLSTALAYARKTNDQKVWKVIINRSDFDTKTALQLAAELNDSEILAIISTKDDCGKTE